jgi:hypothetical protein
MRIVSIINDPLVVEKILKHLDLWRRARSTADAWPPPVEKILKHLDLWRPQAHSPPVSKETKIVEEALYDYTFFDYLPA